MSFPALNDFEDDPGWTPSRCRVYTYLRKRVLTFGQPKAVKTLTIMVGCRTNKGLMGKPQVRAALDWLVEAQYLIEHPREYPKDSRIFTLAYSRQETVTAAR